MCVVLFFAKATSSRPRVLRDRTADRTSLCFRVRGDGVGYAAGPGYLITYLVRRHPRVELRPDLLRPERVGPRAELALRLDFLVRVQNLVDLVPRQQG